MKVHIYIVLSLLVLSCTTEDDFLEKREIQIEENVVSIKNSNPVRLLKAWSSYSSYRGYQAYSKKFTVQVANLDYDKNVTVYHEKVNGKWQEIPLSFGYSIGDQNEIWTGEYINGGYGISQVYDDEFVIKYEVNRNTYWDNNNGSNYAMSTHNGYLFADPNISISVDTDFDSISYLPYSDQNSLTVTVDVRNLAPNKEVGVLYTTDGWKTEAYFTLNYNVFWDNGPLFSIQSPNQFDIERWSGSVSFDKSIHNVAYVVVYKVNGQEYWDSNYGQNYTVTKQVYH